MKTITISNSDPILKQELINQLPKFVSVINTNQIETRTFDVNVNINFDINLLIELIKDHKELITLFLWEFWKKTCAKRNITVNGVTIDIENPTSLQQISDAIGDDDKG